MDPSNYREPPARGSSAGSVVSSQSSDPKRRRTTYNTPIPLEYRHQFLRTPDTAFSPPASQNGKPEPPLFGSSTNRTLFGSPSAKIESPTVYPQIPSRQSPGQSQLSPPRPSSMQRTVRRPGRPGITPGRSNVSSVGPSRGTSVAGSVNGNSARPPSSLSFLGSSVPRPPGSTMSSVESGSFRGSVSNYTASTYSRPLPSAEELKKRADPLINFLGKSIQRAKGALYESKEAEKEAQKIKEREDIRRSKEEEERRRRDVIFQQIMEEEAERERQELIEEARALQRARREEAAANKVQTTTPADSQTSMLETAPTQSKEEARPHFPNTSTVESHKEQVVQTTTSTYPRQLEPSSPATIRRPDAQESQQSKSTIQSERSVVEDAVVKKQARNPVLAYNKYQFSDEELLDENEEDEPATGIPAQKYNFKEQPSSTNQDDDEASEEDEAEDYESDGYDDDGHGELEDEEYDDDDDLEYSEEEGEAAPEPKKFSNPVIEIIDDSDEEVVGEDSVDQHVSHQQEPASNKFTARRGGEGDGEEEEEEEEEDYEEGEEGEEGEEDVFSEEDELAGEAYNRKEEYVDDYSSDEAELSGDELSEEEQVEVIQHGAKSKPPLEEEMMDVDDSENNHEASSVEVIDLEDDDDMDEVADKGGSKHGTELSSGIVPAYEEDMDICLDFSDTEAPAAAVTEQMDADKKLDKHPEAAETAAHLEALAYVDSLAHEDKLSNMDDWKEEMAGESPQKFPAGKHVWRTISDTVPAEGSFEEVPTERESEVENDDEDVEIAISPPPSFIDIMAHKHFTEAHPPVATPTEKLKIIDDDADFTSGEKDRDEEDRMELLDEDHKPVYESERDGAGEEVEQTPIVSHSTEPDAVEKSDPVTGNGVPGTSIDLDESEPAPVEGLSGRPDQSEVKNIDDLLNEKQEAFNQEMEASDRAGNMEPFIEEEAQMAFDFNRDVVSDAEENSDGVLLDTEKAAGGDIAPVTLNKKASPIADTLDGSEAAPIIFNKEESSVDSTEKDTEPIPPSTPNKKANPMADSEKETHPIPTIVLNKESSPIPEPKEDVEAELIAISREALSKGDAHQEVRQASVEVQDDSEMGSHNDEVAAPVESTHDVEVVDLSEELGAGASKDESPRMAEVKAQKTIKDQRKISDTIKVNTSEEQILPKADEGSTEQQQPEKSDNLDLDPALASSHINSSSTTFVQFSSTHVEYRAVIDEDVPTTVLTVKAFDAEVLETTEATDFQLPPAPDFSTPDPRPFEIEEMEEDLESVDVTWKAPDSPMTGTTEIYIRETKEEKSTFDVEILREGGAASASDEEDEQYADAEDAEEYADAEDVEDVEEYTDAEDVEVAEYADAKDGKDAEEYADAENDEDVEEYADAEDPEDADAEVAEEYVDADEEVTEDDVDESSVYEDGESSANEDGSDHGRSGTTPTRAAQQLTPEDNVHKPSSRRARDEDEDYLSIDAQRARMEPSDLQSTSETTTPTRSLFAVVVESPIGSARRRTPVASQVEVDAAPSVVNDDISSPTPKKRKRDSEEEEVEYAVQKVSRVQSGSISRSRSPVAEEEKEVAEEAAEAAVSSAEDDELEQHQQDIVDEIAAGGEDQDGPSEVVNEGIELRDGKVVVTAPAATSEKNEDTAVVGVDTNGKQDEGLLGMELRDGKVVGVEISSTKDDVAENAEGDDDKEEVVKVAVPEQLSPSPSKGMELRDGKVLAATPSRETSMEPRETQGMSLRRGKVLATPNRRDTSATPSMSPPLPIGVSHGEEILPKSQKGRRAPKAKASTSATPVRRSTRIASPMPPSTSQVLSPLPEVKEAEDAEEAPEEIVVKSTKAKRTSKKRPVAEVSTDEVLQPAAPKEGPRSGKRAKTVSRGPSIEPEEGGLKSRLRRKA